MSQGCTEDFKNKKSPVKKIKEDRKQLPIVLAKRDNSMEQNQESEKPQIQPTILIKSRDPENRSSSPTKLTPQLLIKKDEPHQQCILKNLSDDQILSRGPEMKTPVKIIDDYMQFINEGLSNYLIDQPDFLVIGCIGLQGVGKSTIMSYIANKPDLFTTTTTEHFETTQNCTNGIQAFVMKNRVILLDCQPILSSSIAYSASQKRVGQSMDSSGVINDNEMVSLQLTAFLLSVCHIVLLVQDWFFDANIFKILQTAEMLKPPMPTSHRNEELIEYFPHIVFVQNKAFYSDFSIENIKTIQQVYTQLFVRSRLHIQSGISIANGNVINELNPNNCGEPINLFLLANNDKEEQFNTKGFHKMNPGQSVLINEFRKQLLKLQILPLTHTNLTEKGWFHYCIKVWDSIKKSQFFNEYNRLQV
ncbi:nonsense-mediated mRNA decay factor SMG9-like [Daktulosphaira vitifoliae]|uniref:nonsense-mediated mRNA decay factor SMG9-like n=1 Tax=Daktulosphaira vitifoliae TaxID=58002 RepID=UPI0021A9B695|nr:nonsense-mediated mRNA decay factor SMG9-like [Daktulosphaira vitifoliae]